MHLKQKLREVSLAAPPLGGGRGGNDGVSAR